MSEPEKSLIVPNLRQAIDDEVRRDSTLISERGVSFGLALEEHTVAMAGLFKRAYERGDYFASRYDEPENQIFNPGWLAEDLQDPGHIRLVFPDHERQLLGTSALFHDSDSEAGPLMTSDATQIDHNGRGMGIMRRVFERIVPVIEASWAGLATNFVLTPESKGLRRTLQTDLGMIALGIHPHALHHRQLGITRSEISAAKYRSLTPKPANLLPEFEPLYRIVQMQLPSLLEPNIVSAQTSAGSPRFVEGAEVVRTVDATDPRAQLEALEKGWQPVEFNPDTNLFKVAQFPGEMPDLDFILTNEHVPANRLLVRYLINVLYGSSQPDRYKGESHE
jgi:hypothetical protein